ncbi:hypothetical protein [Sorangium sp. So ce887]|uniref:hypothetical protein n=1 Tax=Sorangium sp. So ce887 TaxID=3133324 RepID=UPI003F5FFB73
MRRFHDRAERTVPSRASRGQERIRCADAGTDYLYCGKSAGEANRQAAKGAKKTGE